MFRLSGLICLLFATFSGVLLFYTSQSVQRAEKSLSEVSYKVLNEEETLRVLTAEWDYLNRPERLEKLVSGNFDINQDMTTVESFAVNSDDIPVPVIPAIPKTKPNNFFYEIRFQEKNDDENISNQSSTIKDNDRKSFDKLLNNFADGGDQ